MTIFSVISHMLWNDHFFSHLVSLGGKKKNAQGKVLRFQNKAGLDTEVEVLPFFLSSPYILSPGLLPHYVYTEHFRITTFATFGSAFLTSDFNEGSQVSGTKQKPL